MSFIISTDSCFDEKKQTAQKENIHVIPMTFICGDQTFKDDFAGEEEYVNFYNELTSGKIYKTASLNSVEVEEHFTSLLKQNQDVVHVTLSSGLSVTYNVVKDVAEAINAKSKHKVYVVDSLSATGGQNLIVKILQRLMAQNYTAEQAASKAQEYVNHLNVTFYVSDFDCLKRGGRVSGAQALLGKIANIRPVLDFDTVGKLRVFHKVIGTKKAILTLFNQTSDYNEEEGLPFMIVHTGNKQAVTELSQLISSKFPKSEIISNYIGPTIGSHTGEGALGLVFIGRKDRV